MSRAFTSRRTDPSRATDLEKGPPSINDEEPYPDNQSRRDSVETTDNDQQGRAPESWSIGKTAVVAAVAIGAVSLAGHFSGDIVNHLTESAQIIGSDVKSALGYSERQPTAEEDCLTALRERDQISDTPNLWTSQSTRKSEEAAELRRCVAGRKAEGAVRHPGRKSSTA